MDEIGSIAGDDSLDLNSTLGKATSRSRKASSARRSRPRSANSATAAEKSRKINGPGAAITSKSRGKINRGQRVQGQGSRMRAGGDEATNKAGSLSEPLLHPPIIAVVASAEANGDENNPILAARTVANSEGLKQQSEDNENNSIVEAKDAARLLPQFESRNQEVESRCRHLENRCTQLEGVVERIDEVDKGDT